MSVADILRSLKYSLSGPLLEKFASPCFRRLEMGKWERFSGATESKESILVETRKKGISGILAGFVGRAREIFLTFL